MAQSLASAGEHTPPLNSAHRAEMIRNAAKRQAEYDAQVKALHAEISEFKATTIKGDLGFKLSDWAAVYRVSQLTVTDRDALLDCIREGFSALGVGQAVDWVDVAERTPRAAANGYAEPNAEARAAGRLDGLGGVTVNSDRWPQGVTGHSDYAMGVADGEAERDRIQTLGDAAPRRGRGRPRKQPQEAEADAEF